MSAAKTIISSSEFTTQVKSHQNRIKTAKVTGYVLLVVTLLAGIAALSLYLYHPNASMEKFGAFFWSTRIVAGIAAISFIGSLICAWKTRKIAAQRLHFSETHDSMPGSTSTQSSKSVVVSPSLPAPAPIIFQKGENLLRLGAHREGCQDWRFHTYEFLSLDDLDSVRRSSRHLRNEIDQFSSARSQFVQRAFLGHMAKNISYKEWYAKYFRESTSIPEALWVRDSSIQSIIGYKHAVHSCWVGCDLPMLRREDVVVQRIVQERVKAFKKANFETPPKEKEVRKWQQQARWIIPISEINKSRFPPDQRVVIGYTPFSTHPVTPITATSDIIALHDQTRDTTVFQKRFIALNCSYRVQGSGPTTHHQDGCLIFTDGRALIVKIEDPYLSFATGYSDGAVYYGPDFESSLRWIANILNGQEVSIVERRVYYTMQYKISLKPREEGVPQLLAPPVAEGDEIMDDEVAAILGLEADD